MKKFTLSKGTFKSPILEIEETVARKAEAAKAIIIDMLTAEEKYDSVIENFVEFERELLDITLEYKMYGGRTKDWFNTARNRVDRRFFNLLSTCRAYIEFADHCSNRVASANELFKMERSKHYDESFAYMLMDGLRNEVTYAGHAAHVVTFSARREDFGGDDFVIDYLTPELDISTKRLAKNDKLSKRLLAAVAAKGEKLSFLRELREYIRRLSQLHEFLRSLCKECVTQARSDLEKPLALFLAAFPDTGQLQGLVVREYVGENKVNEFWAVPFASRLDYFQKKNGMLTDLERSRITNAIPRH